MLQMQPSLDITTGLLKGLALRHFSRIMCADADDIGAEEQYHVSTELQKGGIDRWKTTYQHTHTCIQLARIFPDSLLGEEARVCTLSVPKLPPPLRSFFPIPTGIQIRALCLESLRDCIISQLQQAGLSTRAGTTQPQNPMILPHKHPNKRLLPHVVLLTGQHPGDLSSLSPCE